MDIKQEQSRLEILRENLGSIQLKDVKALDGLDKEEQIALLEHAHQVFSSPYFNVIIKAMVKTQLEYAVQMSKDWNQDLFARATINGISLVKEAYENYNRQYEAMKDPKNKQPFDKFKPFDQVENEA